MNKDSDKLSALLIIKEMMLSNGMNVSNRNSPLTAFTRGITLQFDKFDYDIMIESHGSSFKPTTLDSFIKDANNKNLTRQIIFNIDLFKHIFIYRFNVPLRARDVIGMHK